MYRITMSLVEQSKKSFQLVKVLTIMVVCLFGYCKTSPVTSQVPGQIQVVFLCDVSCQYTVGEDKEGYFQTAEELVNEIYKGMLIGGVQLSFSFTVQKYSTEVNLDHYICKDGAASCHPLKQEDTFLSQNACPFVGSPLEFLCQGNTGSRLDEMCPSCGSFFIVTEEERLHKLGIGGAAYTGSMCRREKFGIVAPVSDAVKFGARIAHEIGHQFGMPDESYDGISYKAVAGSNLPLDIQDLCVMDAGCDANICVMNDVLESISTDVYPTQFSACSKAAFSLWSDQEDWRATACVE